MKISSALAFFSALTFLMIVGIQTAFAGGAPPAPTTDAPDWISAPSLSNTGSFTVSWDASSTIGATYALEQDSDPNFGIPVQVWTGTATQCNLTGVANGCWYFRVKASETSLMSSYCAADHQTWVDTSIPAPPSAPGVVSAITVPSQAGSPFTVSWSRLGVVSFYQLQQAYTIETPNSPIPMGGYFSLTSTSVVYDGANNSFLVSPVNSGGDSYKFRVRAYILFHGYPILGDWSSWSSLTTVANAPPDAPWTIWVTGSTSGGTMLVNIGIAHNATSYEFMEDLDIGFPSPVRIYPTKSSAPAPMGTENYDITGKTDGIYFHMVRAVNTWGASAWVKVNMGAKVTGSPAAAAPAAPQSVSVTACTTTGSLSVTWSGVADATSYDVEEDDNSAFTSPSPVSAMSEFLRANTSKSSDGTFYYRVRAVNSVGASAWTDAPNPCVVALASGICRLESNFRTAQYDDVLPGSTGRLAMSLKVTADSAADTRFEGFTMTASGSGDDLADIAKIMLYRDSDGNGTWNQTVDVLMQDSVVFTADNGVASFSGLARTLTAGSSENWFVIADFSGSATGNEDFVFSVDGVSQNASAYFDSTGHPMNVAVFTVTGVKLTVYSDSTPGALYAASGANPPSNQELAAGTSGVVMTAMTLTSGEREGVQLNSITIEGSGTGDESTGISSVSLYEDVDADGDFTDGTDRLLGTPALFTADDGIASIALPGETIPALGSLNILVVYDLSVFAQDGRTYVASVDAGRISATGLVSLQPIPVEGLPVTGCTLTIEANQPPPPSGRCGAAGGTGGSSIPGAAIPLLVLVLAIISVRRYETM